MEPLFYYFFIIFMLYANTIHLFAMLIQANKHCADDDDDDDDGDVVEQVDHIVCHYIDIDIDHYIG